MWGARAWGGIKKHKHTSCRPMRSRSSARPSMGLMVSKIVLPSWRFASRGASGGKGPAMFLRSCVEWRGESFFSGLDEHAVQQGLLHTSTSCKEALPPGQRDGAWSQIKKGSAIKGTQAYAKPKI